MAAAPSKYGADALEYATCTRSRRLDFARTHYGVVALWRIPVGPGRDESVWKSICRHHIMGRGYWPGIFDGPRVRWSDRSDPFNHAHPPRAKTPRTRTHGSRGTCTSAMAGADSDRRAHCGHAPDPAVPDRV